MMRDFSTIRLTLRAQLGDKVALNDLLAIYQRPLFDCIKGIANDENDSKDVLQEVLVIISKKIQWLKDPRVFGAWAFRIACRETFRFLKKRKQRRVWLDDSKEVSELIIPVDEPTLDKERIDEIMTQINALSPRLRAVFLLHFHQEMTLSETADVLDIPLGTVKSRLNYGLVLLRNQLSPTKE